MGWRYLLALTLTMACADETPRTALDGPYTCGSMTCTDGQICLTMSSGSQCQVNEDAGVGQYQEYSWACIELPDRCDGRTSCDCVAASSFCSVTPDGRHVDVGCI